MNEKEFRTGQSVDEQIGTEATAKAENSGEGTVDPKPTETAANAESGIAAGVTDPKDGTATEDSVAGASATSTVAQETVSGAVATEEAITFKEQAVAFLKRIEADLSEVEKTSETHIGKSLQYLAASIEHLGLHLAGEAL